MARRIKRIANVSCVGVQSLAVSATNWSVVSGATMLSAQAEPDGVLWTDIYWVVYYPFLLRDSVLLFGCVSGVS